MQNDFNAWINHYNLEFAHKEELNKAWVYCYTHLSPSQRPQIIKFIRDLGADFCMERWDALVKFKEMNSHNNGVPGFFIAKFGDIKGPILHKELSAKVKDNSPSKKKMIENYGEEKKAIKRYYYDVWRVTKKQPLHLLPNFDKRGQQSVKDSFAVDHRISIMYGFRNKISAEEIGNINNPQMLPHTLNSSKCDNCYSVLDYCLHYTIGEENE